MAVRASATLATKTKHGEVTTDRCAGVDMHMGVAASGVSAVATKEMQTSRDSFWGRFMRKIAGVAGRAITSSEELAANSDFDRVMRKAAIGPSRARA